MGLPSRKPKDKGVTAERLAQASIFLRQWAEGDSLAGWGECAARLLGLGDWDWWLEAMKSGDRDSDYRLVHQISCFAVQAEQLGAVGTGTGLPAPSRAVLKAMDELTVRCFVTAPPQFVLETVRLMDGSTEDTHVAEALEWSRFRLGRDRS